MFPHAMQDWDDRRVDLRHFVDLPPVILETEGLTEQVWIVNIARRGFLARAILDYRTGEPVTLRFDAQHGFEARIVWCAKGMVGARFGDPFDHELLRLVIDPALARA